VLVLLGLGAATTSAQVPFHVWLPNAMEAPTPVSAFLHSATMVKAGVYLVGRLRPLFVAPEAPLLGSWTLIFAILGLATMTVAAVLAVAATDIKELLAYSTASHLGLITAGFGFAAHLGAETGAFHILNHATFKATLFLVAGIVAHEAGTRSIRDLGGLRADLPITALIAAVASLSMAGIPPFNGFYSKELLFDTTYEVAAHAGGLTWVFPAVAVLGSVFTFLYSIRFLMLFFGEQPSALADRHVHRPPVVMLVPPALLAGLVAVISVAPTVATDFIVNDAFAATATDVEHPTVHAALPTHISPPVVMSAITIGIGAVAYPFYDRLHATLRAAIRGPVRANWWYDGAVTGLTRASGVITPVVQNGQLRTYVTWTFGGVVALTLGGYLAAGVAIPALVPAEGMTVAIGLVLALAVVAAVAVEIAPSHVAGVLTLSILGFMIAIFYILADAPDLALTQLLVETLVLVIFLLVLDRLPPFYGDLRQGVAVRDAVLSLFVGVTVFVSVVASTAASPNPALKEFLLRRAYLPEGHHGGTLVEWGGGHNVVNVILVDFRGFDTLGEISVVGLAALSVLTLIRMRNGGGADG
jgi:multicomponent Na+:H+ antiporter subunit A